MRQVFKIDGQNFSDVVNKYNFQIEYFKREGQNGFTAVSGLKHLDILAEKVRIIISTNGMTAQRLSAFLQALDGNGETVSITYTDKKTGREMTDKFYISSTVTAKTAYWTGEIEWIDNTVITMEAI